MKRSALPKHVSFVLLLSSILLFVACSKGAINFVIINQSDRAIEIRCWADDLPGDPTERIGQLAIASASQLRAYSIAEWRVLSSTEYQVDRENRTVTTYIKPGEALRVAHLDESMMKDGEPMAFSIEEIAILGAYGEISLKGKQVPGTFIQEADKLYTLTYK